MNNFPTPAEIESRRETALDAPVAELLARIEEVLVAEGAWLGGVNVPVDTLPNGAKGRVTKILAAAGWTAEFVEDRGEGEFVRVTAKPA